MNKIFITLLLAGVLLAQNGGIKENTKWLFDGKHFPDQTSGIMLVKSNATEQQFLIVDDTGEIHRFTVTNDTVFNFYPVTLTNNVVSFLQQFPKTDFEEVSRDPENGRIYISIEGNGPDSKSIAGIFEVFFSGNDLFSDTVVALQKLHIKPEETFKQYLANNIGYEGLAIDKHAFYLGLEGFQTGEAFADSTYIYVVDKTTLTIISTIATKALGIHTICGLYAVAERSLLVIDRNGHSVHYLEFDEKYKVQKHIIKEIIPSIPGYPNLTYTMALESVSGNGKGAVYIIDDPWKSRYKPQKEIYGQLDENTQKKFRQFVPIIYKFDLLTFTKE
ncbi:MAG: hypothetical protein HY965_09515 [Ignavibacteriales bacterium]|nr:hypothetical protein [Ignavibacteriales bacterium]